VREHNLLTALSFVLEKLKKHVCSHQKWIKKKEEILCQQNHFNSENNKVLIYSSPDVLASENTVACVGATRGTSRDSSGSGMEVALRSSFAVANVQTVQSNEGKIQSMHTQFMTLYEEN